MRRALVFLALIAAACPKETAPNVVDAGARGEGEGEGEGEGDVGEGEGEGEGDVGEGEGEGEGDVVGEGEGEGDDYFSRELVCGDGLCVFGLEDCLSCQADCGACRQNCGNGRCNGQKNCLNCPADCGVCPAPVCGDGSCNGIEGCDTCTADCGDCPICGDALCNGREDCNSCFDDCGTCPFCGDATCNTNENCATCADDCGECPPSTCGDLVCQANETCATCPSDCGRCPQQCTVDGACAGAAARETCVGCGADCNVNDATVFVCGNGECEASESSDTCAADCGPRTWPSPWTAFEADVVTLMNQHRAAGTSCPSGPKAAVPALTVNAPLQRAAELHSWDMSYAGYFSHTSCNGRTFTQRAAAQGGSSDAENIAVGYSTPAAVVQGWMSSSAGHCDAIMSPNNSVVGIGYARVTSHHWTAMFR